MARRKKGNPVHGWLILDKPFEMTSTTAVADIESHLRAFTGAIMQVPPQFSAIKIEGNRAYDLAREGETVALEARPVVIDRLVVTDMPDADTTVFEAECGKGTYVRAIARDLGRALGCFGHVTALRRTRVGPFSEANAVTLAALDAAMKPSDEAGAEASH